MADLREELCIETCLMGRLVESRSDEMNETSVDSAENGRRPSIL